MVNLYKILGLIFLVIQLLSTTIGFVLVMTGDVPLVVMGSVSFVSTGLATIFSILYITTRLKEHADSASRRDQMG